MGRGGGALVVVALLQMLVMPTCRALYPNRGPGPPMHTFISPHTQGTLAGTVRDSHLEGGHILRVRASDDGDTGGDTATFRVRASDVGDTNILRVRASHDASTGGDTDTFRVRASHDAPIGGDAATLRVGTSDETNTATGRVRTSADGSATGDAATPRVGASANGPGEGDTVIPRAGTLANGTTSVDATTGRERASDRPTSVDAATPRVGTSADRPTNGDTVTLRVRTSSSGPVLLGLTDSPDRCDRLHSVLTAHPQPGEQGVVMAHVHGASLRGSYMCVQVLVGRTLVWMHRGVLGQYLVWDQPGERLGDHLPDQMGDHGDPTTHTLSSSKPSPMHTSPPQLSPRVVREVENRDGEDLTHLTPPPPMHQSPPPRDPLAVPSIIAIRIEESEKGIFYDDKGASLVQANVPIVIRMFGDGLDKDTQVKFTTERGDPGTPCEGQSTAVFQVYDVEAQGTSGRVTVTFPLPGGGLFYICMKQTNSSIWLHQGDQIWATARTYEKLLPFWLQCTLLCFLMCFSGLFSGLNLGLMALDRTELKIVSNTGTDQEKKYAKAIDPVRRHGNYLLCTLLLGNVLVNSSLTILLDDLTSGLVAIVGSTLGIVIIGEIIPQAICSRHGLAVGAKTVYVTKFFMLFTFPLSFPISLILDKLLGEEIGNVYNRKRLKELLEVTRDYHDLEKDEVNIISGALELKEKTVSDVMTKIDDVFMLSIDACLDFETVSDIMKQGYSRVPVFENTRSCVVTVLHIKNLAFVDPDDNMPLRSLCQFYHNPYFFVFEDTTLDYMFKEFKEGDKGHMAFVQRVNNEGEGDPFYETIGLVTLEDVIEELIQSEIIDETDIWLDNQRKQKRNFCNTRTDFTCFAETKVHRTVSVSPQLVFATFQYLSTALEPFSEAHVSERVLRKLLQMNVIHHIKVKNRETSKEKAYCVIYEQGKLADYFVLIIEGRVEVTVGKEDMLFESGPFTYFGTQALTQSASVGESPSTPVRTSIQSLDASTRLSFIPDFTVRAVTDVFYLRITRSLYMGAKQATKLERSHKDGTKGVDQLDLEIDKYFLGLEGFSELVSTEFLRQPNPPNGGAPRSTNVSGTSTLPHDTSTSTQARRPSVLAKSRATSIPNDIAASPMGRRVSLAQKEDGVLVPNVVTMIPGTSAGTVKNGGELAAAAAAATEETKLLGDDGGKKGKR